MKCTQCGQAGYKRMIRGAYYIRCPEHMAPLLCQCGKEGRPFLDDGIEYLLCDDCVMVAAGFDDGMLKARPEGVKQAAELLAETLAKRKGERQ